MASKEFGSLAVAGVYSGYVLEARGGFGAIHEVMDHLYPGIMTIGVAAMMETASAHIAKQHPALVELGECSEGAWEDYAARVLEKMGPTLAVDGPAQVSNVDIAKTFDSFMSKAMTNPAAPASSASPVEPDAGPLASARTLEGQLSKGHWATVARLIAECELRTTQLAAVFAAQRVYADERAPRYPGRNSREVHSSGHIAHDIVQGAVNDKLIDIHPGTIGTIKAWAELEQRIASVIEGERQQAAGIARCYLGSGTALQDAATLRADLEAAQAWKPLFMEVASRLGFGAPDTWRPAEVVRNAGDLSTDYHAVIAQRDALRAQLAEATARAEAAELQYSLLVDHYNRLAQEHERDADLDHADNLPPPATGTKAHHHLLLLEAEVERAMLRRERAEAKAAPVGDDPHGLGVGWAEHSGYWQHTTGAMIRPWGLADPGWMYWRVGEGERPHDRKPVPTARGAAALALGVAKVEAGIDWLPVWSAASKVVAPLDDDVIAVAIRGSIVEAVKAYHAELERVGAIKMGGG